MAGEQQIQQIVDDIRNIATSSCQNVGNQVIEIFQMIQHRIAQLTSREEYLSVKHEYERLTTIWRALLGDPNADLTDIKKMEDSLQLFFEKLTCLMNRVNAIAEAYDWW